MNNKTREILSLALLLTITIFSSICAGEPPGPPPTTPVGNAEMSAVTILGMAVYGYWKMRK